MKKEGGIGYRNITKIDIGFNSDGGILVETGGGKTQKALRVGRGAGGVLGGNIVQKGGHLHRAQTVEMAFYYSINANGDTIA